MIEESYLRHKIATKALLDKNKTPNYSPPNSIDAWRHNRMRDCILPLINYYPKTKWITLGDGRFGSDAIYLQNKGLDVLSTNISDATLSVSHKLGYIHKFKEINAEDIKEEDNSFDFVFCKESYHHFPRPFIALYEMLRVARKGVFLIEPQDSGKKMFDWLKILVKIILRKDQNLYFEKEGNFIYKININEFSKVMTAMNFRYVTYKKINDFYVSSFASKSIKSLSKAKIITLLGVNIQNLLCKLRLMDYGIAVVVLFKDDIDKKLLKSLNNKGFRTKRLPINPYV
jgi:SAM-dependent methyltransferase